MDRIEREFNQIKILILVFSSNSIVDNHHIRTVLERLHVNHWSRGRGDSYSVLETTKKNEK
jgi:hypothetical protein